MLLTLAIAQEPGNKAIHTPHCIVDGTIRGFRSSASAQQSSLDNGRVAFVDRVYCNNDKIRCPTWPLGKKVCLIENVLMSMVCTINEGVYMQTPEYDVSVCVEHSATNTLIMTLTEQLLTVVHFLSC